jgi:hypothetical protein
MLKEEMGKPAESLWDELQENVGMDGEGVDFDSMNEEQILNQMDDDFKGNSLL